MSRGNKVTNANWVLFKVVPRATRNLARDDFCCFPKLLKKNRALELFVSTKQNWQFLIFSYSRYSPVTSLIPCDPHTFRNVEVTRRGSVRKQPSWGVDRTRQLVSSCCLILMWGVKEGLREWTVGVNDVASNRGRNRCEIQMELFWRKQLLLSLFDRYNSHSPHHTPS